MITLASVVGLFAILTRLLALYFMLVSLNSWKRLAKWTHFLIINIHLFFFLINKDTPFAALTLLIGNTIT